MKHKSNALIIIIIIIITFYYYDNGDGGDKCFAHLFSYSPGFFEAELKFIRRFKNSPII
jgi:hypothetical protein